MSVCVQRTPYAWGGVAAKAWVVVLGSGVGGRYPIGAVILGVTGAQVAPLGVGGKGDVAGGAWEAEPGVLCDAVGVGRGAQLDCRPEAGVWLHLISAQDGSPRSPGN